MRLVSGRIGARRRWVVVLAATCTLVATPPRAEAWNSAGHMVVAEIAWAQLTAKARQRATEMLLKHPHYDEDLKDPSVPEKYRARAVFRVAATWPDIIKRYKQEPLHGYYGRTAARWGFDPKDEEDIEKYERALHLWHYIDLPVERSGYKDDGKTPLSMDYAEGSKAMPENAIQALERCRRELLAGSDEEKAVALCWVIHLVGDLHQPLHCAQLWSKATPKGDAGGNLLYVSSGGPAITLHSYWDGLLGSSTQYSLIVEDARRIGEQYDEADFDKDDDPKDLDPKSWVERGRDLADGEVYAVQASTSKKAAPALGPDYKKMAEATAEERAALAGTRLAHLLNDLLK